MVAMGRLTGFAAGLAVLLAADNAQASSSAESNLFTLDTRAWGTTTTVYLPGGVPLEMVSIPPGSFQMGSNDDSAWSWNSASEKPVHTVSIAYPFQMGRFEVTQRQWLTLMSNPGWASFGVGDNYPAYYVSWNDIRGANGFLDKLNAHISSTGQGAPTFRLPSESEWEYACRAGGTTRFCFGDSDCASTACSTPPCNLDQYAWFWCNNGSPYSTYGTKPVGGKLPNTFGLFDMHGNLWEWCEDCWHADYNGAPADGSAWVTPVGSFCVVRGGDWTNHPRDCRSAVRNGGIPDTRDGNLGFRVVAGPGFLPQKSDDFTTASGWSAFALTPPGAAALDHDRANKALRGWVAADPSRFRVAGWMSDSANWLPYSAVGSTKFVRGKFYVYATGQSNPAQRNTIPSVRMRLSNRYAVTSMLEVFGHVNADAGNEPLSLEIAPSTNPTSPSLYRVDFDPIDVPFLAANGATEGIARGFEAYAVDPQDNGYVCLAESVIGTYNASLTPAWFAPAKVYQTSVSDAGDLKSANPGATLKYYSLLTAGAGEFGTTDAGYAPVVTETAAGVTMDATAFDNTLGGNRIAIATLDLDPGMDNTARVRVEENKQYHVRFHATSTQQSNLNAMFRPRARTVRYAWSQKLEIGGALSAGSNNNTIAAQALPGVGCQNPDKEAGDTAGGWYTMIVNTPLSIDIRPDLTGALSARMPNLSAQPGPGEAANSRRDLRVGFDLLDTLSTTGNAHLEKGQFTVDRVEVRVYNKVPD
jgi:formylglycine-generating enzyme required for sulfatase activity